MNMDTSPVEEMDDLTEALVAQSQDDSDTFDGRYESVTEAHEEIMADVRNKVDDWLTDRDDKVRELTDDYQISIEVFERVFDQVTKDQA